ncbi:MAG: tRNA guanosine(34) transglycosylase Tgt, partial [Spirochaetota bacterium]
DTIERMNVNLILSNTYHLYLRPGVEVIKEAGGLHKFSSWRRNILTDSGGYQIYSLAPYRKINTEGVRFRSHIDGSYHNLTPEKIVDIQMTFGSDILMPLDFCTPFDIPYKKALEALIITTRWAERSSQRWRERCNEQSGQLFGIIQGNFFSDLRKRSAVEIIGIDFPGYAIGGLSVGEPFNIFLDFLSLTSDLLPDDKIRYLMGIGTPEYILAAVENGIDLFDCVFPTRIARNGAVFTKYGIISLKREKFAADFSPIDEKCECLSCRQYSKAYLRHLFKAKEILAPLLATEHNLFFITNFLNQIRLSIEKKCFKSFKQNFLNMYSIGPNLNTNGE